MTYFVRHFGVQRSSETTPKILQMIHRPLRHAQNAMDPSNRLIRIISMIRIRDRAQDHRYKRTDRFSCSHVFTVTRFVGEHGSNLGFFCLALNKRKPPLSELIFHRRYTCLATARRCHGSRYAIPIARP